MKIKCNAGSYTDVGVTTNSSGVVSITDLTTLTNLLLNAGTCIVGSSLDIQVSKDGYVTTENSEQSDRFSIAPTLSPSQVLTQ